MQSKLNLVRRLAASTVMSLVLILFFMGGPASADEVPYPNPDPMDVWVDIMPGHCINILDPENFRVPAPDPRAPENVEVAWKNYSTSIWVEVDVIILGGPDVDLNLVDLTGVTICHIVPTGVYRGDWMSPPPAPDGEVFCGEWTPDGYTDIWIRVRKADMWEECEKNLPNPCPGDRTCFEFRGPIKGAPDCVIKGRDIVTVGGTPDPTAEPFDRERAGALGPCYPNPFNPVTAFTLTLDQPGAYEVDVFNVTGQRVRAFSGYADAGKTTITWDGTDDRGTRVASGLYLYRLRAGELIETRKMMLLK